MSNSDVQNLLDKVAKKNKPLCKSRTSLRAQVDCYISQFDSAGNTDERDPGYIESIRVEIESLLKEIKS